MCDSLCVRHNKKNRERPPAGNDRTPRSSKQVRSLPVFERKRVLCISKCGVSLMMSVLLLYGGTNPAAAVLSLPIDTIYS